MFASEHQYHIWPSSVILFSTSDVPFSNMFQSGHQTGKDIIGGYASKSTSYVYYVGCLFCILDHQIWARTSPDPLGSYIVLIIRCEKCVAFVRRSISGNRAWCLQLEAIFERVNKKRSRMSLLSSEKITGNSKTVKLVIWANENCFETFSWFRVKLGISIFSLIGNSCHSVDDICLRKSCRLWVIVIEIFGWYWDIWLILCYLALADIGILGWYWDIWLIFGYLADIGIFGWYCEIWLKIWYLADCESRTILG